MLEVVPAAQLMQRAMQLHLRPDITAELVTIDPQTFYGRWALDDPSEGCDIDLVPKVAKQRPVRFALSNSFGFGGTNATLVLRRFVS